VWESVTYSLQQPKKSGQKITFNDGNDAYTYCNSIEQTHTKINDSKILKR
jgi:hypothetical protein